MFYRVHAYKERYTWGRIYYSPEELMDRFKQAAEEVIKANSISSMLENKVCRLIFFENELKEMEQKYEGRKKIVLEKLDKIENPLYKDILFLRYICFEKWEDIADILGYSRRSIFYKHKEAIKKFTRK